MTKRIALSARAVIAASLVLGLTASGALAQCVSLTTIGFASPQDFNTLASSGTSSTTPTGWTFSEASTNANATYTIRWTDFDASGADDEDDFSLTPATSPVATEGVSRQTVKVLYR